MFSVLSFSFPGVTLFFSCCISFCILITYQDGYHLQECNQYLKIEARIFQRVNAAALGRGMSKGESGYFLLYLCAFCHDMGPGLCSPISPELCCLLCSQTPLLTLMDSRSPVLLDFSGPALRFWFFCTLFCTNSTHQNTAIGSNQWATQGINHCYQS